MSKSRRIRRSGYALSTAMTAMVCSAVLALVTAVSASSGSADPGAGVPTASVSRAGSSQTGTLVTARTQLTSTAGEKLLLDVTGFRSSRDSTVVVALTQGGESHSWSFPAKSGDVVVDGQGAGRITLSPTAMGGLGKIALTFEPFGGVKKQTCQGSLVSKQRPVAVRGLAQIKTGTSAWGDVGSAKKARTFRASQVLWSYDADCPVSDVPCTDTISWNGFESVGQVVTGISGTDSGGDSSLTAYRTGPMASPSGAYRTDVVIVAGAPALTLSGSEDEMTLRATLGDGSLEIQGSTPITESAPCGAGGTLTETSWFGTVTNGTRPLTVPAQVFGDFTLQDDAFASFTRSVT